MSLIRALAPLALGVGLTVAATSALASTPPPVAVDHGPASPTWIDQSYVSHPAPVIPTDGTDLDTPAQNTPNIPVGGAVKDVPADLGQSICQQLADGAGRDAIVAGLVSGPEAFAPEEAQGLVDQAPGEWCPQLGQ